MFSASAGGLQSLGCQGPGDIAINAEAGQTYYLLVGSETGGEATLSLRSFPVFTLGVSVDSGSVDSRTGLLTLRGTVTNSHPANIYLYGTVQQKSGHSRVVTGQFGNYPYGPFVIVPSDGQASWSVQVLGKDGSFGGGAVVVTVHASAQDPVSGQYAADQVTQTVQLRGKK